MKVKCQADVFYYKKIETTMVRTVVVSFYLGLNLDYSKYPGIFMKQN